MVVQSFIWKCITCRYLIGRAGEEKMADILTDRLSTEAPFTYTGLDMLGPFMIKQHRKKMKRYAIIFICLSSCNVHLEVIYTMKTDSLIQSLRRFIACQRNIYLIIFASTNFPGAQSELQKAFWEGKNKSLLTEIECWLDHTWKNNAPSRSHKGEFWEYQIRSAWAILSALMYTIAANNSHWSVITGYFCVIINQLFLIVWWNFARLLTL